MKKILFIKLSNRSFIEKDVEILSKIANVEVQNFKNFKWYTLLLSSIKIFTKIIIERKKISFVYIWFADYHAILPIIAAKMTSIPSIIVIGGYDAAKLPDYNYGVHIHRIRSKIVKLCCKYADKLLAVSYFTRDSVLKNISNKLLYKTDIVYNCVDTSFFKINNNITRSKTILTICSSSNAATLKIKGVDFFKKIATEMPEYTFIVVGVSGDAEKALNNEIISNLTIYPNLNKQDLYDLYNQSAIIAQFSKHESFGVALGEGMACGCVPITIEGLGAAEIVADNLGLKLKNQNINEAKVAISNALLYSNEQRILISNHILSNFSEKNRLETLLHHLTSLDKIRK